MLPDIRPAKIRLASDAVGEASPQRRRDKLGERERRHQQRHLVGRRVHRLREERQKRDDDAEADEVDENGQEQRSHGKP
jgi:hypothetical protein